MLRLALVLVCLTPVALAQSEPAWMIHVIDYDYLPDPIDVPPGVEVVVMNFGPSDANLTGEARNEFYHTVTSSTDRSLFDVQRIPPDGSSHPFRAPMEPGTYPYYCVYHGDAQGNGMAGTLVVNATDGAPPPATGATPPAGSDEAPVGAWIAVAALGGLAALVPRRR